MTHECCILYVSVNWVSIVQIMAWCLFGSKPFSKPMMVRCRFDPWEQISIKLEFYHLHSRKCIRKCRLPNWGPFCPGPDLVSYTSTSHQCGLYPFWWEWLFSFHNYAYDMMWCDISYMIWYIYIWYDMIWYDMIWYDMIWYDMIWYGNSSSLLLEMVRIQFGTYNSNPPVSPIMESVFILWILLCLAMYICLTQLENHSFG